MKVHAVLTSYRFHVVVCLTSRSIDEFFGDLQNLALDSANCSSRFDPQLAVCSEFALKVMVIDVCDKFCVNSADVVSSRKLSDRVEVFGPDSEWVETLL